MSLRWNNVITISASPIAAFIATGVRMFAPHLVASLFKKSLLGEHLFSSSVHRPIGMKQANTV